MCNDAPARGRVGECEIEAAGVVCWHGRPVEVPDSVGEFGSSHGGCGEHESEHDEALGREETGHAGLASVWGTGFVRYRSFDVNGHFVRVISFVFLPSVSHPGMKLMTSS